jgi:hypothetical protein
MRAAERQLAFETLRAYKQKMKSEGGNIESPNAEVAISTMSDMKGNAKGDVIDAENGEANDLEQVEADADDENDTPNQGKVEIMYEAKRKAITKSDKSQNQEIVVIDLDDESQWRKNHRRTREDSGFEDNLWQECNMEDDLRAGDPETEPMAKRQKVKTKDKAILIKDEDLETGRSFNHSSMSNKKEEEREDEIAMLERQSAAIKKQIEEAEALAEMRRQSAALDARLEAARARRRRGRSS